MRGKKSPNFYNLGKTRRLFKIILVFSLFMPEYSEAGPKNKLKKQSSSYLLKTNGSKKKALYRGNKRKRRSFKYIKAGDLEYNYRYPYTPPINPYPTPSPSPSPSTIKFISLSGNLTFDDTEINQTSQRVLTISNSGNSGLQVFGLIYPLGFSGNWTGVISHGESQNVIVTFKPESVQNYGGTIKVSSDATSGSGIIECSVIRKSDNKLVYSQFLDVLNITIKAPYSVDHKALIAAKNTLEKMLQNNHMIALRMANNNAQLAIIPKHSFISSLPEYAQYKEYNDSNGNNYNSMKIRGAGGVLSQPVSATSEENLLGLENDPFAAEDITVHELAHAIMNLGFMDSQINEWIDIYEDARNKNIFLGAFALKNADEYFAELTQSYFGVNNEINGPLIIKQNDPRAYNFLQSIYGENLLND
jgi:hypothetical protein